jgi:hypothetical protein
MIVISQLDEAQAFTLKTFHFALYTRYQTLNDIRRGKK